MRTCYLVFCHMDGGAVLQLVRRIKELSPDSDVIVRFEDTGFLDADSIRQADGIPLESRIPSRWGSWTQAEMLLEGLSFAVTHTAAELFVTISGQCYPIRDLPAWVAEFETSGSDAVLERIPDHPDDHYYRWRIIEAPRLPPAATRLARHLGWRLDRWTRPHMVVMPRFDGGPEERRWWIGVPRRGHRGAAPSGIPVVKGSCWMALRRMAVLRVLEGADDEQLISFFKTVKLPDESLIPSLILADETLTVAPGVISAKRFPPGKSSPVWLDEHEVRSHLLSGAPFVRKMPVDAPESLRAIADRASSGALSAAYGDRRDSR